MNSESTLRQRHVGTASEKKTGVHNGMGAAVNGSPGSNNANPRDAANHIDEAPTDASTWTARDVVTAPLWAPFWVGLSAVRWANAKVGEAVVDPVTAHVGSQLRESYASPSFIGNQIWMWLKGIAPERARNVSRIIGDALVDVYSILRTREVKEAVVTGLTFLDSVVQLAASNEGRNLLVDYSAAFVKFSEVLSTQETRAFVDKTVLVVHRWQKLLASEQAMRMVDHWRNFVLSSIEMLSSPETVLAVAEMTANVCYALETEFREELSATQGNTPTSSVSSPAAARTGSEALATALELEEECASLPGKARTVKRKNSSERETELRRRISELQKRVLQSMDVWVEDLAGEETERASNGSHLGKAGAIAAESNTSTLDSASRASPPPGTVSPALRAEPHGDGSVSPLLAQAEAHLGDGHVYSAEYSGEAITGSAAVAEGSDVHAEGADSTTATITADSTAATAAAAVPTAQAEHDLGVEEALPQRRTDELSSLSRSAWRAEVRQRMSVHRRRSSLIRSRAAVGGVSSVLAAVREERVEESRYRREQRRGGLLMASLLVGVMLVLLWIPLGFIGLYKITLG